MSIIFSVIILNSISLISGDCGIPGVPPFAQIVNFNAQRTTYPEGYQVKYDCVDPYGLNINGEEKRVCIDQSWTPQEIPICGIVDPDDGKSEFQIEIIDINNVTIKNSFRNNWSLYRSQDSYVRNLSNNFIYRASNETNLWRIKFEKEYPVEIDHSFQFVMVFVIAHNSILNYSSINIEIQSKFTSNKRTCRTKTEVDSIEKLFMNFNHTSLIANSSWEKDIFHKITAECRNNWTDRPFRWLSKSGLEYITGLNLSLKTDSFSPIELILTQLTVDVDCGYPDIPINANYTKSWMNTIYSCNVGEFIGERNLSCHHSGRWVKSNILPKCCIGNECDIKNKMTTIVAVITLLSSAVVVLGLLVIALFFRSEKKRKIQTIERSKSTSNNFYDDIDQDGDQTYDHLKESDSEETNYDQTNCYRLERYNCQDVCERSMPKRVAMKEIEEEYIPMEKCIGHITAISKPNSNVSISDN